MHRDVNRARRELGLTPLIADGNSSAERSARAKKQLRDKYGKWIEMGGGIRWNSPSGFKYSGTVSGFQGDYVQVSDVKYVGPNGSSGSMPNNPKKPVTVHHNNVEVQIEQKARLDTTWGETKEGSRGVSGPMQAKLDRDKVDPNAKQMLLRGETQEPAGTPVVEAFKKIGADDDTATQIDAAQSRKEADQVWAQSETGQQIEDQVTSAKMADNPQPNEKWLVANYDAAWGMVDAKFGPKNGPDQWAPEGTAWSVTAQHDDWKNVHELKPGQKVWPTVSGWAQNHAYGNGQMLPAGRAHLGPEPWEVLGVEPDKSTTADKWIVRFRKPDGDEVHAAVPSLYKYLPDSEQIRSQTGVLTPETDEQQPVAELPEQGGESPPDADLHEADADPATPETPPHGSQLDDATASELSNAASDALDALDAAGINEDDFDYGDLVTGLQSVVNDIDNNVDPDPERLTDYAQQLRDLRDEETWDWGTHAGALKRAADLFDDASDELVNPTGVGEATDDEQIIPDTGEDDSDGLTWEIPTLADAIEDMRTDGAPDGTRYNLENGDSVRVAGDTVGLYSPQDELIHEMPLSDVLDDSQDANDLANDFDPLVPTDESDIDPSPDQMINEAGEVEDTVPLPPKLYHVAPAEFEQTIDAEGLKPVAEVGTEQKRVHMADSPSAGFIESLYDLDPGSAVVYEVDTTGMKGVPGHDGDHHWTAGQPIPPSRLKKIPNTSIEEANAFAQELLDEAGEDAVKVEITEGGHAGKTGTVIKTFDNGNVQVLPDGETSPTTMLPAWVSPVADADTPAKTDAVDVGWQETPTPYSPEDVETDESEWYAHIGQYAHGASGKINGAARGTSEMDDFTRRQIATIDHIVDTDSVFDEDTEVYRGVTGDFVDQLVPGAFVQDMGFMSVTTDPQIAEDFATYGTSNKGAVLQFTVPKGEQYADISELMGYTDQETEDEAERLLSRGSGVKILSNELGPEGMRIVKAEFVPSSRSKTKQTEESSSGGEEVPEEAPGGTPGVDGGSGEGDAAPAVPEEAGQEEPGNEEEAPGEVDPARQAAQERLDSWPALAEKYDIVPVGQRVDISYDPADVPEKNLLNGTTEIDSVSLDVQRDGQWTKQDVVPGDMVSIYYPEPPLKKWHGGGAPNARGRLLDLQQKGAVKVAVVQMHGNGETDGWEAGTIHAVPVSKIKPIDAPGVGPVLRNKELDQLVPDGDAPEAPASPTDGPLNDLDYQYPFETYNSMVGLEINSQLRAGELDPKYQPIVDALDEELADTFTVDDMYVYRGVNGDFVDQLVEGAIIEDSAFVSTSSEKSVARGFAGESDKAAVIEFFLPAGTQAIDLGDLAGLNEDDEFDELEMLLPRNTQFRVLSRTTDTDGRLLIQAEVVDGPQADAPEQTPEAPAVEESAEPIAAQPIDVTAWKKVGGQQGSNPGGTYEDENGQRYYVKQSKSDDHARNEVLAARFYQAAGVDMAQLDFADVGNGKLGTVAPLVPGAQADLGSRLDDQEYLETLQEGFAVDAWLANWDVAGLVFDNVVTDENGNPVRIDPGGALIYRAQGAPKGDAFADTAGEWDTLRFQNAQSSQVFGEMTDEQLAYSAQKVANITPEQIDDIVDSVGFDPDTAQMLKDKLKSRREDIMQRGGVTPETTAPEQVDDAPAAPEMTPATVPELAPSALADGAVGHITFPNGKGFDLFPGDKVMRHPNGTETVFRADGKTRVTPNGESQLDEEVWDFFLEAQEADVTEQYLGQQTSVVDEPVTPQTQAAAVYAYTKDSRLINQYARDGKLPSDPKLQLHMKSLDELIDSSELAEDKTFYRGVEGDFLNDLEIGSVIEDSAYLSVTQRQDVGEFYATKGDGKKPQALFEIKTPAGSKMVFANDHDSFHMAEQEWLGPRGSKIRITGKRTGTDDHPELTVWEAELVSGDAPDVAPDVEMPEETPVFHVSDDPGTSGDGYFPGTGLWGKYGAAGVLVRHVDENGDERFLLVQRGPGVSTNKGKWQLPGGALNSNESDEQGASRELMEELSAPEDFLPSLTPVGENKFEHESGWHYTNLMADAPEMFDPQVDGTETSDAKWFTRDEIAGLQLHPSLASKMDELFGTWDGSSEDGDDDFIVVDEIDTPEAEEVADTVTLDEFAEMGDPGTGQVPDEELAPWEKELLGISDSGEVLPNDLWSAYVELADSLKEEGLDNFDLNDALEKHFTGDMTKAEAVQALDSWIAFNQDEPAYDQYIEEAKSLMEQIRTGNNAPAADAPSAPETTPTPAADSQVSVDGGLDGLPNVPDGQIGFTPSGQKYTTTSDGKNVMEGSWVRHPGKGYEGPIAKIEGNGKYVQVWVEETGKYHGLRRTKIVGANAPGDGDTDVPEAPDAPPAPEVDETPATPTPTPEPDAPEPVKFTYRVPGTSNDLDVQPGDKVIQTTAPSGNSTTYVLHPDGSVTSQKNKKYSSRYDDGEFAKWLNGEDNGYGDPGWVVEDVTPVSLKPKDLQNKISEVFNQQFFDPNVTDDLPMHVIAVTQVLQDENVSDAQKLEALNRFIKRINDQKVKLQGQGDWGDNWDKLDNVQLAAEYVGMNIDPNWDIVLPDTDPALTPDTPEAPSTPDVPAFTVGQQLRHVDQLNALPSGALIESKSTGATFRKIDNGKWIKISAYGVPDTQQLDSTDFVKPNGELADYGVKFLPGESTRPVVGKKIDSTDELDLLPAGSVITHTEYGNHLVKEADGKWSPLESMDNPYGWKYDVDAFESAGGDVPYTLSELPGTTADAPAAPEIGPNVNDMSDLDDLPVGSVVKRASASTLYVKQGTGWWMAIDSSGNTSLLDAGEFDFDPDDPLYLAESPDNQPPEPEPDFSSNVVLTSPQQIEALPPGSVVMIKNINNSVVPGVRFVKQADGQWQNTGNGLLFDSGIFSFGVNSSYEIKHVGNMDLDESPDAPPGLPGPGQPVTTTDQLDEFPPGTLIKINGTTTLLLKTQHGNWQHTSSGVAFPSSELDVEDDPGAVSVVSVPLDGEGAGTGTLELNVGDTIPSKDHVDALPVGSRIGLTSQTGSEGFTKQPDGTWKYGDSSQIFVSDEFFQGGQTPTAWTVYEKPAAAVVLSPGDKITLMSELENLPVGSKIGMISFPHAAPYEKQADGSWKLPTGIQSFPNETFNVEKEYTEWQVVDVPGATAPTPSPAPAHLLPSDWIATTAELEALPIGTEVHMPNAAVTGNEPFVKQPSGLWKKSGGEEYTSDHFSAEAWPNTWQVKHIPDNAAPAPAPTPYVSPNATPAPTSQHLLPGQLIGTPADLEALPAGSKIWTPGAQDETPWTKNEYGQWMDPLTGVPFAPENVQVDSPDTPQWVVHSVPSTSPTPTPAPAAPPAPVTLPTMPKGTVGMTTDGKKYVTTSNGVNVGVGSTVHHAGMGYTGKIVTVEGNGKYVQVAVAETGKQHGLALSKLTSTDPIEGTMTAPPSGGAVLDGQVPDFSLKIDDEITDGDMLDHLPVGSKVYTKFSDTHFTKIGKNTWKSDHSSATYNDQEVAYPITDGDLFYGGGPFTPGPIQTPAATGTVADVNSPWFGTDKPTPPAKPSDDVPWLDAALDAELITEAEKNYPVVFPGKKLEDSKITSQRVRDVIDKGDHQALKKLRDKNIISQDLHDRIVQRLASVNAKRTKAEEDFLDAEKEYQKNLQAWRKANGIFEGGFTVDGFIAKGMVDGVIKHSTNGQATSWFGANLPNHLHFSQEAKNGLNSYIGSSWGLNKTLRSDKLATLSPGYLPSESVGQFKGMEKAMAEAPPMPADVIIYRGGELREFTLPNGSSADNVTQFLAKVKPGTVVRDFGFGSFAVGTGPPGSWASKPLQIKLRLSKGFKGVYVYENGLGGLGSEREIILNRNRHLLIHKVYQVGGKVHVEAEIVPDGWTPEQGAANEAAQIAAAQAAAQAAQAGGDAAGAAPAGP